MLDEHQREYIERILEETGGKISREDGTAALLDLPLTTLQSRMRRLGVERRKRASRSASANTAKPSLMKQSVNVEALTGLDGKE